MTDKITYLASAYSSDIVAIRQQRFEDVCRVAGSLMRRGYLVYSPICHSHSIACISQLPTDFSFWRKFDHAMIAACGDLFVLADDAGAWKKSVGVQAEVEFWFSLRHNSLALVDDDGAVLCRAERSDYLEMVK